MSMQTYLVGGAIRDELLGLPSGDRDFVVVGSSPEALLEQGYQPVGKDFPVFLHPDTREEYALARTERKQGRGHQGFVFHTGKDVTLEDDLQRRDLTINAIARAADGSLIDPFDGLQDLEQRILRHVSPAFAEDPLRVLRVARFAARLAPFGFQIADETLLLMQQISQSGELETLSAERLWQELHKALTSPAPQRFIEVLRACHALRVVLPEVDVLFGVPQPEKYHPEIDTGKHILLSLGEAARHQCDAQTCYAVLLHDVGKGLTPKQYWPSHRGHERAGVKPILAIGKRLKAPKKYTELAALVSEWHLHVHRALELKPKTLLKVFNRTDALRRPERFTQLLQASEMDARGRTGLEHRDYPQSGYLLNLLQRLQAVDTQAVIGEQTDGKAIQKALHNAYLEVISEAKAAV